MVGSMRETRFQARFIASFAALALGWLSPTACAQPFDTNTSIIFYDAPGNENLDPADAQAAGRFFQEAMLAAYEPLIRLQNSGDPDQGLAEFWITSADLTTLTLELRPGVSFYDGASFNAEMVKQNFERFIGLGARASGTLIEAASLVSTCSAPMRSS